MTRADRLLVLVRRMVEVERELTLLKAEFNRLCGDAAPAAPGQPRARSASLATRVLLELQAAPETAFLAVDVAMRVAEPLESVRAALSKLCAQGTVVRVSRGLYRSVKLPESTE